MRIRGDHRCGGCDRHVSATRFAAWCASALVLAWSGHARATNGNNPVAPASFPDAACMTTIVRGEAQRIAIGIPYEDVAVTEDEAPGSRRLQLVATCHDRRGVETLPTWMTRADAIAAATVDPTVIDPSADDVVDEAPAWTGAGHDGDGSPCVVPIIASSDRIPITCEATADGVAWDGTDAPAGAYLVWGYSYEGPRSVWTRRPGVVRVVDDDPGAAPPAVAFSSPAAIGEVQIEAGMMIEGCAAGMPGTTLTLAWARWADLERDPDDAWTVLAELDADAFAVPFMPPADALYDAIVLRAEVRDPMGRTFAITSSDYVSIVPGCGAPSGGVASFADSCGVSEGSDAPTPIAVTDCDGPDAPDEPMPDAGSSSSDDDTSSESGAELDDAAVDHGCGCSSRSRGDAWWAVLGLVALVRRRALAMLAIAACGGDDGTRGEGSGAGIGNVSAHDDESSAGTGVALDDDDDGGDTKLDAGAGTGDPAVGCDPDASSMGDMVEFSYIWIANSPEGTVSKIDTRTGVEVGRYYTGPTQSDDPSRTSVNLRGDVAIANRNGGIVKIAAQLEDCVDRNGNGTIETSSGAGEVLPWTVEECWLWHRDIQVDPGLPTLDSKNPQGPRPTAWDLGEHMDPCADDHRVWVGWYSAASQVMHLLRLDGKTGEILDAIDEPQYPSMLVPTYGPYGGAIDPENAMWVLGLGGPLARVDPTTLDIDRWDVPSGTQPYGIAIDGNGDPWLASLTGEVIHFDRAASSFDVIEATTSGLRGLQVDRNGVVWAAHGVPGGNLGCGLVAVDVATRTLIDGAIDLPGCVEPVGVSVDVDGYVWLPDKGKDGAFKVDPTTYATDFVGGLVSPYTYSDMTGSGLALVAFPPAG